ncbi:MAG TPA: hypothetical protein VF493_14525, partial [Terriglobales bacterium]
MKMVGNTPRPGKHGGTAKPVQIFHAIEVLDIQLVTVVGGARSGEPTNKESLGCHDSKSIVIN